MSTPNSSHSSLFPPPSTTPPSELAAVHWPGTTAESTDALLDVLKDNHERWHVFFNDLKFHNHSAHRALAVYGLGADGELIKKMYEKDSANQKKAYESPEEITEENFVDHLADEHYFTAYRRFFTQQISSKGIGATLEEFIFSRKYNLAPAVPSLSNPSSPESKKKANKGDAAATLQNLEDYANGVKEAPHMFSRFLSGLLHPFIHTGYGAEFGLPGTIVEGLAQTSVTEEQCTPLTPSSLFHSPSDADTDKESPITTAKRLADSLHKSLDAALLIDPTSTAKPTGTTTSTNNGIEASDIERDKIKPVHALSILHRISTSPTLVPPDGITDERQIFEWTMEHHGNTIANLVAEWSLDTRSPSGVHKAVEEVAWVVCLMYGVGGWTGRERVKGVFNADFFLMHLVTSSLFLPALLSQLQSSRSKRALLRGYMGTIMAWYIGRGKPKLDIKGFFDSPLAECTEANRWVPLLTPSITHNDEHVPKLVRALAHWGRLFGTRPKGFFGKLHEDASGGDMLEGGELVDGSLFVRAAELTVQRMGRKGEGVFWDMAGFYDRK